MTMKHDETDRLSISIINRVYRFHRVIIKRDTAMFDAEDRPNYYPNSPISLFHSVYSIPSERLRKTHEESGLNENNERDACPENVQRLSALPQQPFDKLLLRNPFLFATTVAADIYSMHQRPRKYGDLSTRRSINFGYISATCNFIYKLSRALSRY